MSDDLISRQAAIDELHKYFADGFEQDRWWNSTHVLCAIKNCLPARKWIPCSERLPHECDRVLVTVCVDGDYEVDSAIFGGTYIDGFDTHIDWDEGNKPHIVAWMPLPSPYKEKKDE